MFTVDTNWNLPLTTTTTCHGYNKEIIQQQLLFIDTHRETIEKTVFNKKI